MATCPHCRGHLTDSHRCPTRPASVALEVIAVGILGALAALLLAAWWDPREQAGIDGLALAAGAVIAVAIDRALRG